MSSRSLPESLVVDAAVEETAEAEINDTQENKPFQMEVPGRGIHPGKLTAMLRTNFGVSAYRVTVSAFY
jgi:hypothetical protein